MDRIKRLNPEDRENLVAYLDGELDDLGTSAIDSTLSESPVARHEVEMLTRTWEMLDLLPQERASDSFTQTTIQTALLSESETTGPGLERFVPKLKLVAEACAWACGLMLSAWIGVQSTRWWVANPTDELIRDLPVIENIDTYREVKDVQFLEGLKQRGLFDESN